MLQMLKERVCREADAQPDRLMELVVAGWEEAQKPTRCFFYYRNEALRLHSEDGWRDPDNLGAWRSPTMLRLMETANKAERCGVCSDCKFNLAERKSLREAYDRPAPRQARDISAEIMRNGYIDATSSRMIFGDHEVCYAGYWQEVLDRVKRNGEFKDNQESDYMMREMQRYDRCGHCYSCLKVRLCERERLRKLYVESRHLAARLARAIDNGYSLDSTSLGDLHRARYHSRLLKERYRAEEPCKQCVGCRERPTYWPKGPVPLHRLEC